MRSSLLCCLALFVVSMAPVAAQDSHLAPGNSNPLVPGYFADPTIKKFGDTWYLYATTDGTNVGRGLPQVWTSKDFVHWTNHRLPRFYDTEFFWAPDVTQLDDGRFFLVHSNPCVVHGYTGGSPYGPWTSVTPGKPLVPDHLIQDVITLDGQTFRDTDGSLYLTWCTWAIYPNNGCGVGRLTKDLTGFDLLYKVPNTEAERIFEGSFLFERKGIYYLTYSCDHCENETYHLRYATSDKVTGKYVPGRTNPILKTTADQTVHGPGHHSVIFDGDDAIVVYHRHNNPHTGGGYDRQVCADRMYFEADGAIRPIVPTHKGIGLLAASTQPFANLALGKKVTASSVYSADFRAEGAVDDNNGTLWRPASNALPSWLCVDLGEMKRIQRVHTQFEYATFYYQYLLEVSADGQEWRVFSDKRSNRLCGSPMVDVGDVDARYLRVTVTGTEQQGFVGAIWNLFVFADSREDPPQEQIHVEADDLVEGAWTRWDNTMGMLGGGLVAVGGTPTVKSVAGRKAVVFEGAGTLMTVGSVPASIGGRAPLTVAAQICEQGTWQHRAFTTDGRTLKFYVDGKPSGATRGPFTVMGPSLGVVDAGPGGALASLRVFNRCLWPSEIAGLAAEKYVPPPPPAMAPHGLLVQLDAAELTAGAVVDTWPNHGGLGGAFTRTEGQGTPRVDLVAGVQAVVFDGRSALGSERIAPRSLSGNGAFTVAAWVCNPQVGDAETVVNWVRRGGPDSTCGSLMYGTQGAFGAASHWGWTDMGWKGPAPKAGAWHHLALVFDGIAERTYVDGLRNDTEFKMLWAHAGSHMYVGAANRGEEGLSGAVAAVRIYDTPLPEAEIVELAGRRPTSAIAVHLDAGRLPYGPVQEVDNPGSAGGAWRSDKALDLADVGGRLGLVFTGAETLVGPTVQPPFTLVTSAQGQGGSLLQVGSANLAPAGPAWHHIALVCDGRRATRYVDGVAAGSVDVGGGGPVVLGEGFVGAVAFAQVHGKALDELDIEQSYAAWTTDRKAPSPDPAAFAVAPRAVTTTMVTMAASPAQDAGSAVEYWFAETTGHPGGANSGWLEQPVWRNDGLQPDTEYAYTVRVRDAAGNVTAPSAPVTVRTDAWAFTCTVDDFVAARDYKAQGTDGTLWDGVFGAANATTVRAGAGRVHLESPKSFWIDQEPKGLLLYKNVVGDFVAETELADMMGLAKREAIGNQAGGLMVRVADLDAAGPGEDLIAHSIFPAWGCGDIVTSLDSGGRPEWSPRTGWEFDRHLQMERCGDAFHCRTSADGKTWRDMPGSPVERPDMHGLPLQVGLYHATHGGEQGWVEFKSFRLVQRIKFRRG